MDGVTYMRMKFYVDGSKRKGVVVLDLKKVPETRVVAECALSCEPTLNPIHPIGSSLKKHKLHAGS